MVATFSMYIDILLARAVATFNLRKHSGTTAGCLQQSALRICSRALGKAGNRSAPAANLRAQVERLEIAADIVGARGP